MAKFKQSTEQIIQKAQELKIFIKSKTYSDLITGYDITSETSPYRNGEQTLTDAMQILDFVFSNLVTNGSVLDLLDPGMRSNFQSYLNNLESWLTSNPVANWSNIISYTNTLYQWMFSYGLGPTNSIDEKLLKKYQEIKIQTNEFGEIRDLRNKLENINRAVEKLDQANDIINFVNQTKRIQEIDSYVQNAEDKIKSLLLAAENLLTKGSDAVMAKHFSDVANNYKSDVYGYIRVSKLTFLYTLSAIAAIAVAFYIIWISDLNFISKIFDTLQQNSSVGLIITLLITIIVIQLKPLLTTIFKSKKNEPKLQNERTKIKFGWLHYFLASVLIVLPITIFYISTLDRLDYQNEFLEVIANGLIRAVYLSPALLLIVFVSRNFLRKDKRRESYEFKAVTATTLQGHILMLKEHAAEALPEVSTKIISQIYEEPKDSFSEKENSNLEAINELLSIGEKIKNISKS